MDTTTPGVTSRTAGAGPRGGGRDATRSPRPSTSAQSPARKNGTSEPRPAAIVARSDDGRSSPTPQASSAPSIAAAASLLPPPSPAATGIRLSSKAARAGSGPSTPRARQAARVTLIARMTRLRSDGPSSGIPGPVARNLSPDANAGARARRSARSSLTITECSAWKPSSRRPVTASVRLSLAGASRTTGVTRREASFIMGRSGWALGAIDGGLARPAGAARSRQAGRSSRPPRASAVVDRQRSRPPRGRHPRAPGPPAAAVQGRSGASSGARGSLPAQAATARPPSPAGGVPPRRGHGRPSATIAESTSGAGSNAERGTSRTSDAAAWYWTNTER